MYSQQSYLDIDIGYTRSISAYCPCSWITFRQFPQWRRCFLSTARMFLPATTFLSWWASKNSADISFHLRLWLPSATTILSVILMLFSLWLLIKIQTIHFISTLQAAPQYTLCGLHKCLMVTWMLPDSDTGGILVQKYKLFVFICWCHHSSPWLCCTPESSA